MEKEKEERRHTKKKKHTQESEKECKGSGPWLAGGLACMPSFQPTPSQLCELAWWPLLGVLFYVFGK